MGSATVLFHVPGSVCQLSTPALDRLVYSKGFFSRLSFVLLCLDYSGRGCRWGDKVSCDAVITTGQYENDVNPFTNSSLKATVFTSSAYPVWKLFSVLAL